MIALHSYMRIMMLIVEV